MNVLAGLIRLACSFIGIEQGDFSRFLSEPWMRRIISNYVRGIAIFGPSKPQTPAAPVIVVWEITNECNLNCVYCHVDARKPLPDELTKEEKMALIDELADMGVVALMIAGGEPLCSPDLFDVIKHAHERGLYTVVITNGQLLTEENAKRLFNAGLNYIKVSIDSASPDVHNSLRGESSWEKAIEGIRNSVEVGLLTGVAFTLTKASVGEVPKVISLAKILGVRRIILFNFVPAGRGKSVAHLDLDGPEREKILEQAFEETYKLLIGFDGLEISTTAPQGPRIAFHKMFRKIPPSKWFKAASKLTTYGRIQALAGILSKGCSAGITVISIRPNGEVKPCDLMPITIGNVRKNRFKYIWLGNSLLIRMRNRGNVKGWCSSCRFLTTCSGCRSRAYAFFGDLFASDPNCLYGLSLKQLLAN